MFAAGVLTKGTRREGDNILEGSFDEEGALIGQCKITRGDWSAVGVALGGELDGEVKEFEEGELIWKGLYKDGMRHGNGTLYNFDGSSLNGVWVENKLSSLAETIFRFKDGSAFKGVWEESIMSKGIFYDLDGKKNPGEFQFEDPNISQLAKNVGQKDPYEAYYVYVRTSTLSGAGEGLFMRRSAPKGTLVCFYSGIKVPQAEVDKRNWEQCANTLSLNYGDDLVVDVPSENLLYYQASLGHKANTSYLLQNAEYCQCVSPRFGLTKGIRVIKQVDKDEELFVDYGYMDEFPDWFKEQYSQEPLSNFY